MPAILLQIVNPDVSAYQRVSLIQNAAAGQNKIYVTTTNGFASGNLAVIGNLGNVKAETVTISAVDDSANEITLSANLRFAHEANEPLSFTYYDTIKVYSGLSADQTTHTSLGTVSIAYNRNMTMFVDTTATDAEKYYSYEFTNAASSMTSVRTLSNAYAMPYDITPDYIRENYLYGLDLTQDDGFPLPDGIYWHGIKAAITWLEQQLNIDIFPRTYIDEPRDYTPQDYNNFCFLTLKHYPVLEVTALKAQHYSATIDFPLDWIRLKDRLGVLNLVPTQGSFASYLMPSEGGLMPLFNKMGNVPNFWKVSYRTGFAPNELPYNLKDMIYKKACFMPLNILGDLVGGIAIASKSIGIDGLSQSINTTNSAENAGYSGRLRQYERELKPDLINAKSYWRRIGMVVV